MGKEKTIASIICSLPLLISSPKSPFKKRPQLLLASVQLIAQWNGSVSNRGHTAVRVHGQSYFCTSVKGNCFENKAKQQTLSYSRQSQHTTTQSVTLVFLSSACVLSNLFLKKVPEPLIRTSKFRNRSDF